MALLSLKTTAIYLVALPLVISCQPETEWNTSAARELAFSVNVPSADIQERKPVLKMAEGSKISFLDDLHARDLRVIPSPECGATEFTDVQWEHFTKLAADPLATENFERYRTYNHLAARMDLGEEEYFGPDGEYTSLVNRIWKDLERFWDMEGKVDVHGQHNETLNDREMLVALFSRIVFDYDSKDDLYKIADEILQLNKQSPILPESPLFASEGYSTFNGLIILGDGLIQMFTEAGIEPKIAWIGIFSHEWMHQIQMQNFFKWYPAGMFDSPAEQTRHIELEADFFSAYYMTHKRGATLNWKSTTEFLELFFQAGDCSFDFEMHHGTPEQRMQSALLGYHLAASAQKKGKILTEEEVHEYFMEVALPEIL
jgi:hypothetical protein